MQVIFIVVANDDVSSPDTKVFNYESPAREYQFELKRTLELEKIPKSNVVVYEKEVIK